MVAVQQAGLHSGSRAARCDQVNHNSLCDMAGVVRAAVMGPNIISSVSRDLPRWAPGYRREFVTELR